MPPRVVDYTLSNKKSPSYLGYSIPFIRIGGSEKGPFYDLVPVDLRLESEAKTSVENFSSSVQWGAFYRVLNLYTILKLPLGERGCPDQRVLNNHTDGPSGP